MRIRVGCEMTYELGQVTPMIAILNVHSSRVSDLERPDYLITTPSVPVEGYRDSFGNWCNRLVAPAGTITLKTETVVRDSGRWDSADPGAEQTHIQNLPADPALPVGQPLLRDGSSLRRRLEPLWISSVGLAPRPGDLRLRARSYHLRLRTLARDTYGIRGV